MLSGSKPGMGRPRLSAGAWIPSAHDWVETQSGTSLCAFWPLDGAAVAARTKADMTAKVEVFILIVLMDCSSQWDKRLLGDLEKPMLELW